MTDLPTTPAAALRWAAERVADRLDPDWRRVRTEGGSDAG